MRIYLPRGSYVPVFEREHPPKALRGPFVAAAVEPPPAMTVLDPISPASMFHAKFAWMLVAVLSIVIVFTSGGSPQTPPAPGSQISARPSSTVRTLVPALTWAHAAPAALDRRENVVDEQAGLLGLEPSGDFSHIFGGLEPQGGPRLLFLGRQRS